MENWFSQSSTQRVDQIQRRMGWDRDWNLKFDSGGYGVWFTTAWPKRFHRTSCCWLPGLSTRQLVRPVSCAKLIKWTPNEQHHETWSRRLFGPCRFDCQPEMVVRSVKCAQQRTNCNWEVNCPFHDTLDADPKLPEIVSVSQWDLRNVPDCGGQRTNQYFEDFIDS